MVALPFERLFGLAANALDPAAVQRVLTVKGLDRGESPIAVIVPDRDQIEQLIGALTPLARQLADVHWPGPLTLLVPAKSGLPAALVGDRGLIGVRVAGPCPAADLARSTGLPLTATSANRAGEPDPLEHDDLARLGGVDLIVPGRVPGPPGSTVVDASGNRPMILRQGVVVIAGGTA